MAHFFTLVLAFDVQRVDAQTTESEPLAEVNGERITTEELNRALGEKLSKLYEQIYTIKRRELDSLIAHACRRRRRESGRFQLRHCCMQR